MAEPLIQRVYDLKVSGYDDAIQKVEALTAAFNLLDSTKKKLNAELREKTQAGDTDSVNALIKKIKELEAEMAKLKTQKDSAAKETALLAKAEKDTADALLKIEKATVSTARAEQIRAQVRITENKELQRQLDIEEKQRLKLEKEKTAVDALEGSYLKLKAQRQALEKLTDAGNKTSTFTVDNQSFTFDSALQKIKELKIQEAQYLDQKKLEQVAQDRISTTLEQTVAIIRLEKSELEKAISVANQTTTVSFKGNNLNFDQAVAQMKELNTLETNLTEKLAQEQVTHEVIIASYQKEVSSIQKQRTELEAFVNTENRSASFSSGGRNFDRSQALTELKRLQVEEDTLNSKIQNEKTIQDSILKTEQQKIASVKLERTELEAIVRTSAQGQVVTFRGQNFNYSDAIAKTQQLQQAEFTLTQRLEQQGTQSKILAGNYYSLLAAQRQAIELYRVTPATSPFFEEVKKGAVDAAAKVQAFNRSLSPDGTLVGEYKSGIINAFKELGLSDVLRKQRDEINQNLNRLKKESTELAAEYRRTGTAGKEAFLQVDQQLRLNLEQQEQMKKSLLSLDSALHNTGNIGSQISNGIASGFKNAKQQLTQLLAGYLGFQAVFSGLQSGVRITSELADSTTNLEIELGKAAGGASHIVDQLAKLNTRTKLTGLEDIANIAAKAGVSEDKIVGVTQAIDKIKIAFGKDFGDVETGTESLVKLVNVFEGTDKVTGENLLKVGNAVRTLANETVASVPFLNDFSKRMAGLKGISDISLPAVLGLASGFEQFGQSSEVAGTTLTKVIPKLATDTEKYSKVAGITQKAFSDLIKNNPAEALIKVAEGLTKSTGGIEEISNAFADSQLGSGRIAAVLGTVGAKADDFRKAIASAGKAYNDTGNIEDAFARKNTNLAATLDKITKAFADTANSKAFQTIVNAIAVTIVFLINNLPALIALLTLYASGWALANRAMIVARAEMIFQRTILPVLTFLLGGQANAMRVYAVATEFAGKGLRVLTALMGNPIFRIFAAAITLSLIAVKTFGDSINNVANAYGRLSEKQKFLNEIQATATEQVSKTRAEEEALLSIVRNRALADETRAKALANLKTIGGGYLDQLTLENALTDRGTQLINDFNTQLERKARLTAADAIAQRENNKLQQLFQAQFDIQTAIKTKGSVSTSQFTKEFLDEFYKQQGRSASAIGQFIGDKVGIDFKYSGKDLETFSKVVQTQIRTQLAKTTGSAVAETQVKNEVIQAAAKDLKEAKQLVEELTGKLSGIQQGTQAYADASKKLVEAQQDVIRKRKDFLSAINKPEAAPVTPGTVTPEGGSLTLEDLRKQLLDINSQIASLDKIKDKSDVQLKQLKNLREQRNEILRQIKELGGGDGRDRGSRLTGAQKDAFKDIDALKDEQIATQKVNFKELIINEETYLRNVLKINETAADAKLKLLSGKNAEERKQIQELKLFKIEQEEETNKKIFDLRKKQLDSELDSFKKVSELELSKVLNDPNKTNLEKAKAQDAFLTQRFIVQVAYNKNIDALERVFNQLSVENAQKRADELTTIQKNQNENILRSHEAILRDIDESSQKLINQAKAAAAEKATAILDDDSLTSFEKGRRLHQLELQEQKLFLAQQVAADKQALDEKERALKIGLAKEAEVAAARNKLAQSTLDLAKQVSANELTYLDKLKQGLQQALKNITDFFKKKDKATEDSQNAEAKAQQDKEDLDKALEEASKIVQKTIEDVKETFFENKTKEIEKEQEVAEKRLNIEEEQVLKTAESESEKDVIRHQFDLKREQLEHTANEKKKKVALQQMTVDFGVAVIKTLASIAFPFSLIPVAALTLQYALMRAQVQKQQFAEGGRVKSYEEFIKPEPVPNGKIITRPNIIAQANGDNILATVKVGEVILNEEQQRRLGGARVFRSIGVPGFAGGGVTVKHTYKRSELEEELRIKKVRGFATGGFTGLGDFSLGDNLSAPINPSSFLTPSSSTSDLKKAVVENTVNLENIMSVLDKQTSNLNSLANSVNQRIDRIKVQVVAKEVDDTNNKIKKASAVGTL